MIETISQLFLVKNSRFDLRSKKFRPTMRQNGGPLGSRVQRKERQDLRRKLEKDSSQLKLTPSNWKLFNHPMRRSHSNHGTDAKQHGCHPELKTHLSIPKACEPNTIRQKQKWEFHEKKYQKIRQINSSKHQVPCNNHNSHHPSVSISSFTPLRLCASTLEVPSE